MDWWQRNRDFAIRVGAGVAVLLVALIIRGCTYPDDPKAVQQAIGKAQRSVRGQTYPSLAKRRQLVKRNEDIDKATAREAEIVGVVRKPDDKVARKMCLSILTRIGRDDPVMREDLAGLARTSPNACFSQLFDEVRSYYQRVAIDQDIPIVEDLGFSDPRFTEDQIIRAFHTLELVTRAVETAVNARVDSVEKILVRLGRPRPGEGISGFIERDTVEITVRTHPRSLYVMVDAFNDAERFVPIENIQVGGRQKTKKHSRARSIVATLELSAVRIDLEPEEES